MLLLSEIQHITVQKYTDRKENKFFLIYKDIQNGAVAKPYILRRAS
jgi:hypothetical protein